MTQIHTIKFDPPPMIKEFIASYIKGVLFYTWAVGPVGSSKTTALFFKLVYMASLQAPSPDGIRRTRAVVVRNTRQLLRDTTIESFTRWFKPGVAGEWTSKTDLNFMLRFGDVECELLFRPLDTPEDVHRVLSLEVTFAIIDEFVNIPRAIIESLSGRLGRWQPDSFGTPVTNWGMWGASNTSTEDNWWFDYLHDASVVQLIRRADLEPLTAPREDVRKALEAKRGERLIRYFLQPSAFSAEAENVENLPGERGYYDNLIVGKTREWIKQFVEAEWGFSASGKPVVPSFQPDLHVARQTPRFDPRRPLVIGFDPGLAGMAAVFGQIDDDARLLVLGELTAEGVPVNRFLSQRFEPYVAWRFPGAKILFAPDPASGQRGQAEGRTVVSIIRERYEAVIETNNHFELRLNAIEHFTSRLSTAGPTLQIDGSACPTLVRALRGGWRYETETKRDGLKRAAPEKNRSSHVGDGFGYLCRYFHKADRRAERLSQAAHAPRRHEQRVGAYALR